MIEQMGVVVRQQVRAKWRDVLVEPVHLGLERGDVVAELAADLFKDAPFGADRSALVRASS